MGSLKMLMQLVWLMAWFNWESHGASSKSNYNRSHVHESALEVDPLEFPIYFSPYSSHLLERYPLRRYQYLDTRYKPDSKLSMVDEDLIYNMDAPVGVLKRDKIIVEKCALLERCFVGVTFTNPSDKLTICLQEIYSDRVELQVPKQFQADKQSNCLSPKSTVQIPLILYVQHNISLFIGTLYFRATLEHNGFLIEEKIYHQEVTGKIGRNHFNLNPIQLHCPLNESFPVKLRNREGSDLYVTLIVHSGSKIEIYGKEQGWSQGINIRMGSWIQFYVEGRQDRIVVQTRSMLLNYTDLHLPIRCRQELKIENYHIGIVTEEKVAWELPLHVTNFGDSNITIESVILNSTTRSVELRLPQQDIVVNSHQQHLSIGKIILRSSRNTFEKKCIIIVYIRYTLQNNTFWTKRAFIYYQIRMPISVGQRRFIDASKKENMAPNFIRFPIRNNLNLPLRINQIFYDPKLFQVSWMTDRKLFTYPNQHRQEFKVSYVGQIHNVTVSPQRHKIIIQFNGNLFVPIEAVIYDHSLMCSYRQINRRCQDIRMVNLGWINELLPRNEFSKKIVVRNNNPLGVSLAIKLSYDQSEQEIDSSVGVYGPFPSEEEIMSRRCNFTHKLHYFLKPQQFLILNMTVSLPSNSPSTCVPLLINTDYHSSSIQFSIRSKQTSAYSLHKQLNRIKKSSHLLKQLAEYYRSSLRSAGRQVFESKIVSGRSQFVVNLTIWSSLAMMYHPTITSLNSTYLCCGVDFVFADYSQYLLANPNITERNITLFSHIDRHRTILHVTTETMFPSILLHSQARNYEVVLERQIQINHRYLYKTFLQLRNPHSTPMKYSVYVVSETFVENIELYRQEVGNGRYNVNKLAHLCLADELIDKHSITPSYLQRLFSLDKLPVELSIQLMDNGTGYYVFSHQKGREVLRRDMWGRYVLSAVDNGARVCYRFNTTLYFKRLIESEVVNAVAELHSSAKLEEFISEEVSNSIVNQFYEQYSPFHVSLGIDFEGICSDNPSMLIFKFCRTLPLFLFARSKRNSPQEEEEWEEDRSVFENKFKTLLFDDEMLLEPNRTEIILMKLMYTNRSKTTFHLLIVNNITQFETYSVKIRFIEPLLRVSAIYTQSTSKIVPWDFDKHYFNDWHAYADRRHTQKQQILPILLTLGDIDSMGFARGKRQFELANEGHVSAAIDHIGIQSSERSCGGLGIFLVGLGCQSAPFYPEQFRNHQENCALLAQKSTPRLHHCNKDSYPFESEPILLKANSKTNFTVLFAFDLRTLKQKAHMSRLYEQFWIYLYRDDGYYYSLKVLFKVGDKGLRDLLLEEQQSKGMSTLLYLCISFASLAIIVFVFPSKFPWEFSAPKRAFGEPVGDITFTHNEQQLKKILLSIEEKVLRSNLFLKPSQYESSTAVVGLKQSKRVELHPCASITQEQLKKLKEVESDEQLKMYFNDSEQSYIIPKVQADHNNSSNQSVSEHEELVLLNRQGMSLGSELDLEDKDPYLEQEAFGNSESDLNCQVQNIPENIQSTVEKPSSLTSIAEKQKEEVKEIEQSSPEKHKNTSFNEPSEQIPTEPLKPSPKKEVPKEIHQIKLIEGGSIVDENGSLVDENGSIVDENVSIVDENVVDVSGADIDQHVRDSKDLNLGREEPMSSESSLPEGDEVDKSLLEAENNFGFGSQNHGVNPISKEQSRPLEAYYNVFSSQNPLKKEPNMINPFPWMGNRFEEKKEYAPSKKIYRPK